MNKKVFVSMLTLCVVFLAFLYVAKIFFPQEFMMSIQNERIIKIGTYIDTHKWLYNIVSVVPPFIVYFLYCCASSQRKVLSVKELAIIALLVISIRALSYVDDTIATAIELSSFLFLPYFCKGELKRSAIIYSTHTLSQALSLSIRNLPIYLTNINFAVAIFMTFECYLWLVLFYIIYNYKEIKEEK
jgi:hypothetical protein